MSTSSGGIVLNHKNQVALILQDNWMWGFPKGRSQKGEKLIDTAKREIFEEIGISELILIKKLGSYKRPFIDENREYDFNYIKTIHIFLFKTNDINLKPDYKETQKVEWVNRDKVSERLTIKEDREFYKLISKNL